MNDSTPKPKKRRLEWSKILCVLGAGMGFIIVQECFYLMLRMITAGYTSTAAWLTAAVGVGEATIIACINGYLSLCKVDHSAGGITFEAAKSQNFTQSDEDMI